MLTKTKIALALTIVAVTGSVALADGEFDPNLANRYPAYAAPGVAAASSNFRTAPARFTTRATALPMQQGFGGPSQAELNQFERASSPYRGGGY